MPATVPLVPRHRRRRGAHRRRTRARVAGWARTAMAAAVAAVAIVGVGLGGVAGAHSTLVDSLPLGGETVATLDEIVLEFGDALVDDEFLRVRLETPEGVELPIADAELVDPLTVRAEVAEAPPEGTYFVRYRVTSIDGDLNEGGFLFDVDPAAPSGASGSATWILLGVGVVALAWILVLLRPRAASSTPD